MSTAGKVLVVLGMLASISWPILATGVTQLNRNGNKALIDLADRVTKLEDDLKTTQDEIVKVKDETILVQKQMVRDLAVTGPRQTNMERVKSNREFLSRVQYQLATLQETVKNAEQSRPTTRGRDSRRAKNLRRGEGGGRDLEGAEQRADEPSDQPPQ